MVTPGDVVDSTTEVDAADPSPLLATGRVTVEVVPGLRKALPSASLTIDGFCARARACGDAPVYCRARSAMTMPAPVRLSTPDSTMSIAVFTRASRTSAGVSVGLPDR